MTTTTDPTTIQHGLLPSGTVTAQGTIARTSDTAYQMTDGSWVPFRTVHGPYRPASPLVVVR
jgi:hypothetical protein